jgi:hypothetical protein
MLTVLLACLQVQNIYVPIVLSVLFGVMVILGLAATVLRRLRSGGTFLALLWFWTVIYMIAGPGGSFSYAPWHALLLLIVSASAAPAWCTFHQNFNVHLGLSGEWCLQEHCM